MKLMASAEIARPRPIRRSESRKAARHNPRGGETFVSPAFDPTLIESAEYEWVSPLALPGLLVAPSRIRVEHPTITPLATRIRHDELLESEDGDVTTACQLPGRIVADAFATASTRLGGATPPDIAGDDEYTERAALQLPGLLVAVTAPAEPQVSPRPRGLCADCIHRDCCDFPRPESGVWRCEEYA
jgi:hypothetical protein